MEAVWKEVETEHYTFHYKSGSVAEKELQQVIELQENCYKEITDKLKFIPEKKLIYWLCDTRVEVMQISGFEYETNGVTFLDRENPTIYAVYNEEVKCVGFHEDVHAISCECAWSGSIALFEGLAMYFDKEWWKIPNELCTRVYIEDEKYEKPVLMILADEYFYGIEDKISYPIMGAFTAFLLDNYGIDKYKGLCRSYDDEWEQTFQSIYEKSLQTLEDEFVHMILSQTYSPQQLENARKKLYAR